LRALILAYFAFSTISRIMVYPSVAKAAAAAQAAISLPSCA
jgi:hypothetical protein